MTFMTTKEAAKYMRVTPLTMYKWMRKGYVPCVKLKGSWRVIFEELEKSLGVESTKVPQQRY